LVEFALSGPDERVNFCLRPDEHGPDPVSAARRECGQPESGLGRDRETLAVTQEEVEVYRRLAVAHPDGYEADLARSLERLNRLTSDGAQAPRRRFRFRA